jgi:hypothetical protein
MARPQRFCIFCHKPGLTYEHVWPDWLKKYVPKNMTDHTSLSVTIHQTYRNAIGHSETYSKPERPLMQQRRLSSLHGSRCSPWSPSTLTFAKPRLQKSNAAAFGKIERCPANWKIWIGDYQRGNWAGHLVHFALPISSEHHVPEIMDNGLPRPNTQTMTFTVGRLYVHVVSSVTDIFKDWLLNRTDLMAQIWPIEQNIIMWPRTTMIDRDADQIAAAFQLESNAIAAWRRAPPLTRSQ